MLHPFIFLFGYTRFSAPVESAAEVVEIFRREHIIYRNFSFSEDGLGILFDCPMFYASRVARLMAGEEIACRVHSRHGLPHLAIKYRHRYGIFAGLLLFIALFLLSGLFVWDIRIVGNKNVDGDIIKAELAECGLGLGDFIPKIDTPYLETSLLLSSDNVAWVSINILGCVCQVEIIEEMPDPPEDSYTCADIVAERDGVIELYESYGGDVLISIGQQVREGDVLISGYVPPSENAGERLCVARGSVTARTEREFTVSVPLNFKQKTYTGRKKVEKYIILFEKEVKFFGNSRNLPANCDTIDTVEYFELLGGVLLPFGVRTVEYAEYEEVSVEQSESQALELALYMLRCQTEFVDGSLYRKEIATTLSDTELTLVCRCTYSEEIGITKERKT